MKIVYPISQSDRHLAPILGNLIARHRHLEHQAIVIPTPGCFETAVEFGNLIRDSFSDVQVTPLSFEPKAGWPEGPNIHFKKAAQIMSQFADAKGFAGKFFWHEMDCTPLTTEWVDKLIQEASIHHQPFHGPYGDLPDGKFMLGTAIWPCHIYLSSKLLRFAEGYPFDVYMRWETTPNSSESRIIAHRWRTEKYARRGANSKTDAGRLIMSRMEEDRKTKPEDPLPIPDGTVMVHGCKDGSLARLILKETPLPQQEEKTPEPEPEFAATT